VSNVYRLKDGSLVCHTNWLRDVKSLPDCLTLYVKDNRIIEAIPENQAAWRMRYGRLTYKNMYRDRTIAYLEVKQDAIREALGGRR